MQTFTAEEARTNFEEILDQVQKAPAQISQAGSTVAVILSFEDYQWFDAMKRQLPPD